MDTYLRFAEAVNRLDLTDQGGQGLPEIMENITQDGAQSKTRGVLEGAKESLFGSSGEDDSDNDEEGSQRRSSRSRSSSSSSRSGSSRSRQRTTRGRSDSS